MDLVTWSSGFDPCSDCGSKNGMTFSISGETSGYEKLGPVPPVHDGCQCCLSPSSDTFDDLEKALGI